MKTVAIKAAVLALAVLLAGPASGPAEFYKYRDENGVLRFSDTHPGENVDQVEVYQDSISVPQPETARPQRPQPAPVPPVKQKSKPAPEQTATKFTLQKNRILLPVEIVGTRGRAKVNLIMDTGAQRTFLWRTALPSIGLRRVGRIRASGITGSKYASTVRAKSIKVGPFRLKNAEIAIMTTGRYQRRYDGLLGMDFLSTVRYEIDYQRQVIIWKGLH
jgi:predicted aspartyl protease